MKKAKELCEERDMDREYCLRFWDDTEDFLEYRTVFADDRKKLYKKWTLEDGRIIDLRRPVTDESGYGHLLVHWEICTPDMYVMDRGHAEDIS